MRIEKIPEDAVLIEGTLDDYVDRRGKIYGYNHRSGQSAYPYMKEQYERSGYMYAPINYTSGRKNRRVHRIVAEAFIPNPRHLPIVMHINNKKKDNNAYNLKWGTISENTKQAYIDGLACNARGEEDSQSIPCDMYETATNRFVRSFGSCREAARFTGIRASTIARQVCHRYDSICKAYYFTRRGEGTRSHNIVAAFDFHTDKLIGQYTNCNKAAAALGINSKTVNQHVRMKGKPEWSKSGLYFKRMYLKREEVIEIQRESRVGNA